MGSLLARNSIKEIEYGNNIAYLLDAGIGISATEYKVLQSSSDKYFAKVTKLKYNGNDQLFYITDGLESLSSIIEELEFDSFGILFKNLMSAILDIKSNGFITCVNVIGSFKRIYVLPRTLAVKLVYVPTTAHIYKNELEFENHIRTQFAQVLEGLMIITSPRIKELRANLMDSTKSFEDIFVAFQSGQQTDNTETPQSYELDDFIQRSLDQRAKTETSLKLVSLNAPETIQLIVNNDPYIIGKSSNGVDGILSFNNKISRVHCMIEKSGQTYYISDLNSSNGTFVNRIRIHDCEKMAISDGDIIRLANSDFRVVMG